MATPTLFRALCAAAGGSCATAAWCTAPAAGCAWTCPQKGLAWRTWRQRWARRGRCMRPPAAPPRRASCSAMTSARLRCGPHATSVERSQQCCEGPDPHLILICSQEMLHARPGLDCRMNTHVVHTLTMRSVHRRAPCVRAPAHSSRPLPAVLHASLQRRAPCRVACASSAHTSRPLSPAVLSRRTRRAGAAHADGGAAARSQRAARCVSPPRRCDLACFSLAS
jgi:hypothetical protein